MDITNPQRAKVLVHALPYIQEYSGKIVVIKYGGNAMISEKLKDSVMRDKDDPGTLIPVIHTAEAHALITSGVICGGMLPKVTCCMDAIRWGVHRVFIIDGRVTHAILIEMLTNEGIGTMFVAGQGGNANEYTAT